MFLGWTVLVVVYCIKAQGVLILAVFVTFKGLITILLSVFYTSANFQCCLLRYITSIVEHWNIGFLSSFLIAEYKVVFCLTSLILNVLVLPVLILSSVTDLTKFL